MLLQAWLCFPEHSNPSTPQYLGRDPTLDRGNFRLNFMGQESHVTTPNSPESPDPPTSHRVSFIIIHIIIGRVLAPSDGPPSQPQFPDPEPLPEGQVDDLHLWLIFDPESKVHARMAVLLRQVFRVSMTIDFGALEELGLGERTRDMITSQWARSAWKTPDGLIFGGPYITKLTTGFRSIRRSRRKRSLTSLGMRSRHRMRGYTTITSGICYSLASQGLRCDDPVGSDVGGTMAAAPPSPGTHPGPSSSAATTTTSAAATLGHRCDDPVGSDVGGTMAAAAPSPGTHPGPSSSAATTSTKGTTTSTAATLGLKCNDPIGSDVGGTMAAAPPSHGTHPGPSSSAATTSTKGTTTSTAATLVQQ
ncbi:hypothetical protein L1987_08590 [Smallanthus sonchifolius]|uniref:Uncharacterized protein n=1 Tax=Smallanthus sonchifolius TaxID=185202 RepID=A0ACB9JKM7_9ASTR|nr:hypothetical protein L1987_08590 [Smallanthus sonchifolius]